MKCDVRLKFALSIAAALVALPALSPAATVTLIASDALGATSFNTALHWSNAAAPTAANDYVVGPGLTLRTPSNQATALTFAGNSLSLSDPANATLLLIRNATGVTTTINNLTLDGGQVQNAGNGTNAATAQTLAGNGITLGAAGGTFSNAVAGGTLTVNAPIGGTGPLTLNAGSGTIALNLANTNSYAGNTTITGTAITAGAVLGSVRARDAATLTTTGKLVLNSGVLETDTNVTRAGGTAAGRISLTGAAAGFSALSGNVTVAIGGLASPAPLIWGNGALGQQILVLNNANAAGALTFANAIDLGPATRTLFNTGTAASSATLAGGVSSDTASAGMNFYGGGTTILTTPNAFTGAVTIGSSSNTALAATSGVVRVAASGALGTGVVTIGSGGNGTTGRLELTGGTTLFNAVTLPTRSAATVAVESLGGSNVLANTVAVTTGGAYAILQSDAGTLTLTGSAGAGVAINTSAAGARNVTLQGAGSGVVSGLVANGAGTLGVAKAGAGTWTLSNPANSYTGPTTLVAGTLTTGSLASGGASSGIGAATNVAANLVLAGGTLQYTGARTATDRLFTVGAAGGTLDASGAAEVGFTNPAAHLTVDPATNGTYSSGGSTVTVTAGAVAGLVVGQTVSGTGIPAGAKVTAVNYNAGTFTISANATATGNSAALTFGATPVRTLTLTGSNTGNNAIAGTLANSAAGNVLAVAKTGSGSWSLGAANTYTGATTVTGGTLRATVATGGTSNLLTNAGGVNLGDTGGRLVLDYAAAGTSPVGTVQSILTNEYAAGGNSTAGFLTGQLRSTTLSAGHTLGYGDNGSGNVTLRVTIPGDDDLDGDVDFNDFLVFQANFGNTNSRFDQGNFNYDGATDFTDFLALQANFGSVTGFGIAPAVTAAQVAAMAAFGNGISVPEPAGLALAGTAGIAALSRRRPF